MVSEVNSVVIRIIQIKLNEIKKCKFIKYFTAIFVIYLTLKLSYSENEATILYHGLVFAIYGMCLIGGIISDVWLGHIKTIMYLSIVYAIGTTIVSISSIPMIGFSPKVLLFIGLAFIAIGSGGIKPCVMVFGGTQFKLPEQSTQMASYFSYFILACCIGGLLSTIITPILREDVHCLGQEDCFPLAFGVPAILMTISVGKFCEIQTYIVFKKLINKKNYSFVIVFVLQYFFYLVNHHIQSMKHRQRICLCKS